MKKHLSRLLILVIVLATLVVGLSALTASAATKDWLIKGTFNNWNGTAPVYTNGNVAVYELDLKASTSYKFKFNNGNTWYGDNGTITDSEIGGWTFSTGAGDCTLKTSSAGKYVFVFNTSSHIVTVYSPKIKVVGDSALCGKACAPLHGKVLGQCGSALRPEGKARPKDPGGPGSLRERH